MILALVLFRYEYRLVDKSGRPSMQAPQPNPNDVHQVSQSLRFIRPALIQLVSFAVETIRGTMFYSIQKDRGVRGVW
jgi:hypothetical protein